jgi:hypothetical protein
MLQNSDTIWQRKGKNTYNYPHFRRSGAARSIMLIKRQGEAMQIFRPTDYFPAMLVGRGLRIMLAGNSEGSKIAEQLGRLGGAVEAETEGFAALGAVMDDPQGYGLLVIDSDGLGGAEEGQRICGLLKGAFPRLPVIVLSSNCPEQSFPEDIEQPVRLRAPVSSVSLRVGFEHALRVRILWDAA